jgi:hypothetical protein
MAGTGKIGMTQLSRPGDIDSAIRKHSGWLIPVALLVLIAALCAAVLLYYLAPSPNSLIEEHASPSAGRYRVQLRVGSLSLTVPANYLPYASERSGGPRREVAFYAELPDFHGFTDFTAAEFAGNSPHSRVVHILITREAFDVGESARLKRIYLNEVVDRRGRTAPAALTEYEFRNDSGYRGEDLFVGRDDGADVVMRCTRPAAEIPSPNCMREVQYAPGLLLSYRFKRSQLGEWRQIATGVERLVASFALHKKNS